MRRARQGFTLIEMMLGVSIVLIVMVALMGGIFGQSFLNMNARNLLAAMNDATRVMEQIRQQNMGTNCSNAVPSIVPPLNAGTGQPYATWNAWLNTGAPGAPKSVSQPDAATRDALEVVAVSCQDGRYLTCQPGSQVTCPDNSRVTCPAVGQTVLCTDPDRTPVSPVAPYCGYGAGWGATRAQVGTNEWQTAGNVATAFNPIRVTIAIGWAQDRRAIGQAGGGGSEFTYVGARTTTSGKGRVTTPATLSAGPDADADGVLESQAMLTTLVTCR